MRANYMIIGAMATLVTDVTASALRIYTPVKRNITIVSLKPDWTIDRRTKDDFLRNKDTAFKNQQQPGGNNAQFAVTGFMKWDTDDFGGTRAFWATTDEQKDGWEYKADPWTPGQGVIRNWLKCTVSSLQPLHDDVYVYLAPEDLDEESWADIGQDDKLDDDWLKCYPPSDQTIEHFFKMPTGAS